MNVFGVDVIFISLLLTQLSLKCKSELCENPSVYSVDTFNNNTVRLFRQNDCWDLNGFPDKVSVSTQCSMKDFPFFNPVNKSSKLVTILEGFPAIKDRTFKFSGMFWWSWYIHPKLGIQTTATSVGQYWDQIPKDHGFDAVFHNGDKDDPMLIGLEYDPRYSDQYMKIHYFSTESDSLVPKSSEYFDRNDFPKDLTDVFSSPTNSGHKYMVYILKDDKYCILSDKQKCTEWKSFKQLIGCSGGGPLLTTPSHQTISPKRSQPTKGKPNEVTDKKWKTNTVSNVKRPTQQPPHRLHPPPPPRPPYEYNQKPKKPKPMPITKKSNPVKSGPIKNSPTLEPGQEESTSEGGAQIVISFLSIIVSFVCFAFL